MAELTQVVIRTVARLRTLGSTLGLSEANVEAVAVEDPGRSQHDTHVQVILMGSRRPHAQAGVGLIEGKIRIAAFARANMDVVASDLQRLTDAQAGLVPLIDAIESMMVNTYLEGLLSAGFVTDGSSGIDGAPVEVRPGIVRASIDFGFWVEHVYPITNVKNDGVTADTGT